MRYFRDKKNVFFAIDENQEHLIQPEWVEVKDLEQEQAKLISLNELKEMRVNDINSRFKTLTEKSTLSIKGVGVVDSGDKYIENIDELLFILDTIGGEIAFKLADNVSTITADKAMLEKIKKALILDKIKKRNKKWDLIDKAKKSSNVKDLDFENFQF